MKPKVKVKSKRARKPMVLPKLIPVPEGMPITEVIRGIQAFLFVPGLGGWRMAAAPWFKTAPSSGDLLCVAGTVYRVQAAMRHALPWSNEVLPTELSLFCSAEGPVEDWKQLLLESI